MSTCVVNERTNSVSAPRLLSCTQRAAHTPTAAETPSRGSALRPQSALTPVRNPLSSACPPCHVRAFFHALWTWSVLTMSIIVIGFHVFPSQSTSCGAQGEAAETGQRAAAGGALGGRTRQGRERWGGWARLHGREVRADVPLPHALPRLQAHADDVCELVLLLREQKLDEGKKWNQGKGEKYSRCSGRGSTAQRDLQQWRVRSGEWRGRRRKPPPK